MINVNLYQYTLINNDESTSLVLQVAPAGWKDVKEQFYRHETYHGVLLELESSLKFMKKGGSFNDMGGYYFLKNAYESLGTKADVQLKREKLNRFTNVYSLDRLMQIYWSPDEDWSIYDEYVEIGTIESSKLAKFLTRHETDYNMWDLESTDGDTVPDFVDSYKNGTYLPIDIYLLCESGGNFGSNLSLSISGNQDSTDGNMNYNGSTETNEVGDRVVIDTDPSDSIIYKNEDIGEESIILFHDEALLKLKFGAVASVTDPYTWANLVVYLIATSYDEDGIVSEQKIQTAYTAPKIYDNDVLTVDEEVSFQFDDITVPEDGTLGFQLRFTFYNVYTYGFDSATLDISPTEPNYVTDFNFYEQTYGADQTNVKGLMAHEMLTRQLQLMTSETDSAKVLYAPILGKTDSEFQTYTEDGQLAWEHFTNGYLLRKFNDSDLNASFYDTFKTLSSIYPIGCYYDKVNGYFYIDEISKFYKSELMPFILEDIKDLIIKPATHLYFSDIEAGYPDMTHEDYDGVNDLHCEIDYQSSIETDSSLDLRSEYNASPLGIELSRRKNYGQYASEDTDYDTEKFVTKLDSDYKTIQGGLDDASGIIGIDDYYNLEKTPRQNFKNQLQFWQALYFRNSDETFKFIESSKGADISYTDSDYGSVSELDDVEQLLSEFRLVDPEYYSFTCKYSSEIRDEIINDPHRIIPFRKKDGTLGYGFLYELSGSVYRKTATVKLIAANIIY